MQVYPLPLETQTETGGTHAAILTYQDLAALGNVASGNINLFPVDVGYGVYLVDYELNAPFVSSDGTLVSTTIAVGDTGSGGRFLAATEMNNAGAFVRLKSGLSAALQAYTAADTVLAGITGTAAKNLSTLTAGQVTLHFKVARVTAQSS